MALEDDSDVVGPEIEGIEERKWRFEDDTSDNGQKLKVLPPLGDPVGCLG